MSSGAFSKQDVLDLARNAYELGAAEFEIVRQKCALLVVDMQDEFVRPGWTPFWVPDAAAKRGPTEFIKQRWS